MHSGFLWITWSRGRVCSRGFSKKEGERREKSVLDKGVNSPRQLSDNSSVAQKVYDLGSCHLSSNLIAAFKTSFFHGTITESYIIIGSLSQYITLKYNTATVVNTEGKGFNLRGMHRVTLRNTCLNLRLRYVVVAITNFIMLRVENRHHFHLFPFFLCA